MTPRHDGQLQVGWTILDETKPDVVEQRGSRDSHTSYKCLGSAPKPLDRRAPRQTQSPFHSVAMSKFSTESPLRLGHHTFPLPKQKDADDRKTSMGQPDLA